jgi:hypothetical protein
MMITRQSREGAQVEKEGQDDRMLIFARWGGDVTEAIEALNDGTLVRTDREAKVFMKNFRHQVRNSDSGQDYQWRCHVCSRNDRGISW